MAVTDRATARSLFSLQTPQPARRSLFLITKAASSARNNLRTTQRESKFD